jgi:hypothetical protein
VPDDYPETHNLLDVLANEWYGGWFSQST